MRKLTSNEVEENCKQLNRWSYLNEGLEKQFKLKDFSEAFALMARIALIAEKLDHHPEWSNVYNKINIRLTTHDAGGVTEKDIRMARMIEELLN